MRLSILLVCSLLTLASSATAAPPEAKGKPNRLARESSPYLLQHAYNPVDWYPWGPDAFEKAKKDKKLIFLSIGYSACHWCHVMERESFANAQIAAFMNEHFVCVKVDREERPDIDDIYMTALVSLRQSGGWPLSMFLTHDGKPILGGTYWPPTDKQIEGETVRGFLSILKLMHEYQTKHPEDVQEQADRVAAAVRRALNGPRFGLEIAEPNASLVSAAVDALKERLDPVYGGLGRKTVEFRGTKFPMPPTLLFLQQQANEPAAADLKPLLTLTLNKMAQGGIYDQLAGGFHRYSTERTWTVPHFEKMLYDNAQLAEVYSAAYRNDAKPLYARIVTQTLAWVDRELSSPEGGFYSALDADTEGKEGHYYVWKPEEIQTILGDSPARKWLGLDGKPNFETEYLIPTLQHDPATTEEQKQLTEARAKLLAVRDKRTRPLLDTKVLTAWNGQMIAGYSAAAVALKEPRYAQRAARAAEFVLANLRDSEGRLRRAWAAVPGEKPTARLMAYLEDYAFLTHGLLHLHQATGDIRWLNEARQLTDTLVKNYHDTDRGGFFFTAHDHEKLFVRAKDQYDGVQPSGNSQTAANLIRLHSLTGEARYLALADGIFREFAGSLKAQPTGLVTLAAALHTRLAAKPAAKPQLGDLKPPAGGGAKKSDSVIKTQVKAGPVAADGSQVIEITLTIEKPWHIYANPVGNEQFADNATQVRIFLAGKETTAQVEYPTGTEKSEKLGNDTIKYRVYEGQVTLKAKLKRAKDDKSALEVRIAVNSCKDGLCLPPATIVAKPE